MTDALPASGFAVGVLGGVSVHVDGVAAQLGGTRQRSVLAMLLLSRNQYVSVGDLAEGLWTDPSPNSEATVQVYVSRLRRALRHAAPRIESRAGGYLLRLRDEELDSARFESLAMSGHQLLQESASAAKATFSESLSVWAEPFADLRYEDFVQRERQRLTEIRRLVITGLAAAELQEDDPEMALARVDSLLAEQPLDERGWALRMRALYRLGRQADALAAYHQFRSRLDEELGVEPGPELEELQRLILLRDPSLTPEPTVVSGNGAEQGAPALRLPSREPLLGREGELETLHELSSTERMITLVGTGGCGKTSLAIHLAHRLAPHYQDGAYFVDLAQMSKADHVLPAIAQAIGMRPTGAMLDAVVERLRGRRLVLLLDNFEHVVDSARDLVPIVEVIDGLILITSRIPLHLRAERVFQVEPLAVPAPDAKVDELLRNPAIQLFMQAAQSTGTPMSGSANELHGIRQLCAAVAGLPLAVELVAAQVRSRDVDEIRNRPGGLLPLLKSAAIDAPQRQQTMEATIAWSVDHLVPQDSRHFARLAVLAGSFDALAAASVMGLSGVDAEEQLARYLDNSVLVRQPSVLGRARFRLLQPIREFALGRLAAANELTRPLQQHIAHFESLVRRLATDGIVRSPDALEELRASNADLVLAIEQLAESDSPRGIRFADLLGDYWEWTGRETEALQLLRQLMAGDLDERSLARGHALCAELMCGAGELTGAVAHAEEARRLAKPMVDAQTLCRAEASLAWVAAEAGDGAVAARRVQAELKWARQSAVPSLLCGALRHAAFLRLGSQEATDLLQQALAVAREFDMPRHEMRALENLALNALVGEDSAVAVDYLETALAFGRRFDAVEPAAKIENNLGTIALRDGEYEKARALLLSALRTFDRIGHPIDALYAVAGLGEAAAVDGQWDATLTIMVAAERLLNAYGATWNTDYERKKFAEAVAAAKHHLSDPEVMSALDRAGTLDYREILELALLSGARRT